MRLQQVLTMGGMPVHRKRIKHYHEPGDFHEFTFSCYRRMPLLTNDRWWEMLSRSIDEAVAGYDFRLVAFVFMLEHVHLLIYPIPAKPDLSGFLKAIKRPYSYRIKEQLVASGSPLLQKLTVRERPGKIRFRYWQEGPGYDRNLKTERALLSAIDYIHLNPVRRRLVSQAIQWKWSSCRRHLQPEAPLDPDLPIIHGLPPEFFTNTEP